MGVASLDRAIAPLRWRAWALLPLLVLLRVLAGAGSAAAARLDARPGQVIVTFKHRVDASTRSVVLRNHGVGELGHIGALNASLVQVPVGSEDAAIRRFALDEHVKVAEPNVIRKPVTTCGGGVDCYVPSDPLFGNQWGLTKVDAPVAWAQTKGSTSTKVAVLDTGIDVAHEDLSAKVVANADFGNLSTTYLDLFGHGTHVAGVAAASTDNAVGVAGSGFNVSLMNVKVSDDSPTNPQIDCFASANGITWAAHNGAAVINMSYAGTNACTAESSAVDDAWARGVVLVAAAGNHNSGFGIEYPAGWSHVIAVAATDQNDRRWVDSTDPTQGSNYGSWVSLAAPGVAIESTLPTLLTPAGPHYGYLTGTSMAAPHVSGAAGLLWSVATDTNGDGKLNDEVRARLESTADPIAGTGTFWASGRLNIAKAVTGFRSTCGELGTPTYPAALIRDSPLSYWRLCQSWTGFGNPDYSDAAAKAAARPLTGSGFTGCCTAPARTSTHAVLNESKYAQRFSQSYMVPPSTSSVYRALNFTSGPFTLEVWFRPDTSYTTSTAGWVYPLVDSQYRFALGWAGTGNSVADQRSVGGNGWVFKIWADSTASAAVKTTDPITAGQWYHVVGIYDGSTMRIYVNGELKGSQTVGTIVPYPDYNLGNSLFRFGYDGVDNVAYTNGVFDEAAVYDYTLPADRVLAHYHAAGY